MADRLPLDFYPPVRQIRALLLGVDRHHLDAPTPCPGWPVAALLDHLTGLSVAFTSAARKRSAEPGADGPPPEPSAAHLPPQWRSRLPVLLEELATAWRDPSAWTGTARAGGVTMPATTMGFFAMNELVMHGWDLARATDQNYAADPRTSEVLVEFLSQHPAEGTPGLFGPAVPLAPTDDTLRQAIALAGRNPDWRPPRSQPTTRTRHP
ncbi:MULTISPECIES: TIGR03086 family metal-binding protein [Actinoplanes]|uniref:TIGR03086 family metal-binding protein n=1 Tax=Actinoplanes TaxID=1865 RepID=UPI0005F2DD72|nr:MULTISPECIES: TIGR03086 family metal-binding protein [Actinoplanes]GLY01411.1 TIGR03086 family protein [Actinoplanes sp. NBRC 101535]